MSFGPNDIVPEAEWVGGIHPDMPAAVRELESYRATLPNKDDFIPHHGHFQYGKMVLTGFGYLRGGSLANRP